MKWTYARQAFAQSYRLNLSDQSFVDVVVDQASQGNLITCRTEIGQYRMKREGKLADRWTIQQADGQPFATLKPLAWHSDVRVVTLGERTYTFQYRNNPLAEMVVSGDNQQIWMTIGLVSGNPNTVEVNEHPDTAQDPNRALLHGLAWVLFLPVAQANVLEYTYILAG